jgi:uncharacterized protein YbcV (DUF1398 family)
MRVKSLLAIIMMTFLLASSAFAAETIETPKPVEVPDIRIIMDGKLERFEKSPVSVNNSTLLPLRELLVKLGLPNDDEHIIYNHEEKSVTVWDGKTKIYLLIGQKEAFVNDEPILLNAAPILYNNSTYIPLRFVAETMGKKVVWDGRTRAALICDAAKYENTKQILEKSDEEMAKVKKLKQDMYLTGSIKAGSGLINVVFETSTALDIPNKKLHTNIDMNIGRTWVSTETYFTDKVSYTLNPLLDQWSKKTYTDAEYRDLFEEQSDNNMVSNNDILCTGLSQIDSENDDEILLRGDVFLHDMFEKLVEKQDLGYDQETRDGVKFDDFSIEISLDRTTHRINYITLDMRMLYYEAKIEDELTGTMSIKIEYSDYDGDFVIKVPEDVVKNAVLAN